MGRVNKLKFIREYMYAEIVQFKLLKVAHIEL